jgi:hypothetical protein
MARKLLDYRHRPAKNIERYLIVDAARRLLSNTPGTEFQYVGFGAVEFLDFQLVHRSLGISRMISIESGDTKRAEYNKPFKSIQIVHGHSSVVLKNREIDLDRPTIIWLDYMDVLNQSIKGDLIEVFRSIAAPSFVLFSLNAQPDNEVQTRLTTLQKNVGKEYVGERFTDLSLSKSGLAVAQWEASNAFIREALGQRKDDVNWQQVLNIRYADNARMQTIGGYVLPQGSSPKFAANSICPARMLLNSVCQ